MRKILSVTLVVLMLSAVLVGCGEKTAVSIKLDINGGITEKSYKTNLTTLEELVVEKSDDLQAKLADSDYGKYVEGIGGYVPNPESGEYIEILVDGVSATTGMKEITLADGQEYTFKVSVFTMDGEGTDEGDASSDETSSDETSSDEGASSAEE